MWRAFTLTWGQWQPTSTLLSSCTSLRARARCLTNRARLRGTSGKHQRPCQRYLNVTVVGREAFLLRQVGFEQAVSAPSEWVEVCRLRCALQGGVGPRSAVADFFLSALLQRPAVWGMSASFVSAVVHCRLCQCAMGLGQAARLAVQCGDGSSARETVGVRSGGLRQLGLTVHVFPFPFCVLSSVRHMLLTAVQPSGGEQFGRVSCGLQLVCYSTNAD